MQPARFWCVEGLPTLHFSFMVYTLHSQQLKEKVHNLDT